MPDPTSTRPFAGSRYGSLGDHAEWKVAIEHYHWDRVSEALKLATALGVGANAGMEGWFRLIEAEGETRDRSTTEKIASWLDFETIPEEVPDPQRVATETVDACNQMASRLGWTHGAPTRVSILAADADAPWAIGRYGYMADKYPYDKICVPQRVIDHPTDLATTVAHEYTHVIVLNTTGGKAPRWLDEGMAMLAEPLLDPRVRRAFLDDVIPWESPENLNQAFVAERRNGENSARVFAAYQQAAWIGRYLASLAGEPKLLELLKGFSDNTLWTEAKMRVTGQSAADEALRQVFGKSEIEVFADARRWIA